MKVALLPLGEVPGGVLGPLAASLAGMRFDCSTRGATAPPPHAYVPARGQWDADRLLQGLPESPTETLVAVTEMDLFVEGMRFVFGLTDPDRRVAIVSVARLRSPDPAVTHRRLLKEVVHELGHAVGLAHCPHTACVMHFSNSLEDTDAKGVALCGACEAHLPEEAREPFSNRRRG